jgi:hypothetical protein
MSVVAGSLMAWKRRSSHTASVADRHIETCPAQDGMAWLDAYFPAPEVLGITNRLRDIAEGRKGEPGEERTPRDVTTSRTVASLGHARRSWVGLAGTASARDG